MELNLGDTDACGPTAAQIDKFGTRYTKRLTECASLDERVGQLAITHPLVFFALATKYGPLKARREAVRCAVEGSPLRVICEIIGLPYCLRRIPPEACRARLPHVRWSPEAGRALTCLVPENAEIASAWLPRVHLAHQYAGEEFAIWLASHHRLFALRRPISKSAILVLALYAWNSRHAPLPFGRCTVKPWSPEISIEKAASRAAAWAQQVRVVCDLGPEGLESPWLPGDDIGEYRIAPILLPEQLVEEAAAMQNCVASYSYSLAQGECRLYSMTHLGTHVATIEIRFLRSRSGYQIVQMKGPLNAGCPQEVLRLSSLWLRRHSHAPPPDLNDVRPSREQRLRALMAPYLAHNNECGPPIDQITLKTLFAGTGEIARLAGRGSISRRLLR
ncbi:MAG: hypothetical protein RLZ98_2350 [Pseudomonadota bacterium]|jgi:hypothetical protein